MKLNFPLPKPALGFGAPSNLAGPNAPLIVAPWDDATKYNLIICYFILVLQGIIVLTFCSGYKGITF